MSPASSLQQPAHGESLPRPRFEAATHCMARDAVGAYLGHARSDLHGLVVSPQGEVHVYVDVKEWWPATDDRAAALYEALAQEVVRQTAPMVPAQQLQPVRVHVSDKRVRPVKVFDSPRLRRALVGAAELDARLSGLTLVVSVQGQKRVNR